jgi:hypothetical protein
MVDIIDAEHRRARVEMISAEGQRWKRHHEHAFSKLSPGTSVIIDIATGTYITGADRAAAHDAYEQQFGPQERMAYSFDVDRPIFIGGGIWRS